MFPLRALPDFEISGPGGLRIEPDATAVLACAMRNPIGALGLALILAGCGGTGIPADGNIQTGAEPAEGGISEVPNPNAAMAAMCITG